MREEQLDDDLERAAVALRAGGAVILPTDTVYGLAALPSVAGATEALFRLKERSAGQPLAVLVGGVAQALALAAPLEPAAARLAAHFWPGPLTLVVPRSEAASRMDLGGDPATIGLRWPDHELVRLLASEVGPIATTSANRHGFPTPRSAAAAAAELVGPVAEIIDGGELAGRASTVVDLTGRLPVVLREGAVSARQVERVAAKG